MNLLLFILKCIVINILGLIAIYLIFQYFFVVVCITSIVVITTAMINNYKE